MKFKRIKFEDMEMLTYIKTMLLLIHGITSDKYDITTVEDFNDVVDNQVAQYFKITLKK